MVENKVNEKQPSGFFYDYENKPVTEEKLLRGWTDNFYIMLGLYISGFMVMTAGVLVGSGVSFLNLFIGSIIGNIIVVTLMILVGIIGVKYRLSTPILLEKTFGEYGAKIFNIVLTFFILAWAALGTNMFAWAITDVTGLSIYITGLISLALIWITSVAGYKVVSVFSKATVPWHIILFTILGVYYGITIHWNAWGHLTSFGGYFGSGIDSIWIVASFFVGLNIMASFLTPNITRYAKTVKDVVIGYSLSIAIGMIGMYLVLMPLVMAVLPWTATYVDPFKVGMLAAGVIGGVFVLFCIWTTASEDFWHASLTIFQSYKKIPRWIYHTAAIITAIILIWAGLINYYVYYVEFLGVLWPSIPGILISHYLILPKIKRIDFNKFKSIKLNIAGYITWIISVVIIYFISSIPFYALWGFIFGLLLYIGFAYILFKNSGGE